MLIQKQHGYPNSGYFPEVLYNINKCNLEMQGLLLWGLPRYIKNLS